MQKFGSHLEGKLVVVTGASRGIGRGLAGILAEEGARVVLAARDTDALKLAKAEIEEKGGEAMSSASISGGFPPSGSVLPR